MYHVVHNIILFDLFLNIMVKIIAYWVYYRPSKNSAWGKLPQPFASKKAAQTYINRVAKSKKAKSNHKIVYGKRVARKGMKKARVSDFK